MEHQMTTASMDQHMDHQHMDHQHMDHSDHNPSENDPISDHSGHMSGHMGMYFTDMGDFNVLFNSWAVKDDKDLAWTCVVLALACVFYEFLKVFKTKILRARNKKLLSSRW